MALEVLVSLVLGDPSTHDDTHTYSVSGVRGLQYYEERVLDITPLTQELSLVPEDFRLGTFSVELDNADLALSRLKAGKVFVHKILQVRLVDIGSGEVAPGGAGDFDPADFDPADWLISTETDVVFEGEITGWSARGTTFTIDASSTFARLFENPVSYHSETVTDRRIDAVAFPDAPPESHGRLPPLVIGSLDTASHGGTGGVDCVLIDVDRRKYAACIADNSQSTRTRAVWVNDTRVPNSQWSRAVEQFGGRDYEVVSVSLDAYPGGEFSEGAGVSADVDGLRTKNSADGVLSDNPVLQLRRFLAETGFSDAQIDAGSFAAAAARFAAAGVTSVLWAVDERRTVREVVDDLARGTNAVVFLGRNGKVSVSVPYYPGDATPARADDIDEDRIARDSMEIRQVQEIVSGIDYQYRYSPAAGQWEGSGSYSSLSQRTALGRDVRVQRDLPFVYDAAAADAIIKRRAYFMRVSRVEVSLDADPALYRDIEIGQILRLRHRRGIGTNGWPANALFSVIGLSLDIRDEAMLAGLRLVSVHDDSTAEPAEGLEYVFTRQDPAVTRLGQALRPDNAWTYLQGTLDGEAGELWSRGNDDSTPGREGKPGSQRWWPRVPEATVLLPNPRIFRAQRTVVGVPTVTIAGGGGSKAAAYAEVAGGRVTGITVTNGGSGYTSAPSVAISEDAGSGAAAAAQVLGGKVTGITVTNGGSGYVDTPTRGERVSAPWTYPVAVTQRSAAQGLAAPKAPLIRTIYRRATAKPSVAAGTYDGTDYTPPAGWVEDEAVGDATLWLQFIVIDPNDDSVTSEGVVKAEGEDGTAPEAPLVRVAYRRGAAKPGKSSQSELSAAWDSSTSTFAAPSEWQLTIEATSGSSTLWQQWIIIDPNDDSVRSEGVVQAEGRDGVIGADGADAVAIGLALTGVGGSGNLSDGQFRLVTSGATTYAYIRGASADDRDYVNSVPVGSRLAWTQGGVRQALEITARANALNARRFTVTRIRGSANPSGNAFTLNVNYVVGGEAGEAGIGVEYAFARTTESVASIPSNQRPLNSWGFDQTGTVNGLAWSDGAPTLTSTLPKLWRSQRAVIGQPADGAAVADDWSEPRVVGRFGPAGSPGARGADAVAVSLSLRYETSSGSFAAGDFWIDETNNHFYVQGASSADREYIGEVPIGARISYVDGSSDQHIFAITAATSATRGSSPARRFTYNRILGSGTPSDEAAVTVQFNYARRGEKGDKGNRGIPGAAGPGVDARLLLRRASTKPTIGGGTWDGTTYSPPSNWTEAIPAQTDPPTPLWAAFALLKTNPTSLGYTAVARFSVDPDDIPDRGINAATKLVLNSITDTLISDDAVRTRHLLARAITGDKVAAGSLVAEHVAAGTLEAAHMAAGTLSASNITAGVITALVRFLSPDIVARDPDEPRRFIRLNDGTIRFGDDGRIGAEVDAEIDDADYVLVGKFRQGETFEPPTWTQETAPAQVSAIDSGIALGAYRRYPSSASGKPSNRAGVYVRSKPRELLASDSQGDAFVGAMQGVGSLSLGTPTAGKLASPLTFTYFSAFSVRNGVAMIGDELYRLAHTLNYVQGIGSQGYAYFTTAQYIADVESPHIVQSIGTHEYDYRFTNDVWLVPGLEKIKYRSGWIVVVERATGKFQVGWNSSVAGVAVSVDRSASSFTASAASALITTLHSGRRRGPPDFSRDSDDPFLAFASVTVAGRERVMSLCLSGAIWLSDDGMEAHTLSDSNLRSQRRGTASIPAAWYDDPGAGDVRRYRVVSSCAFGSDMLVALSDNSLWYVSLGDPGTAAVTPVRLGAFGSAVHQLIDINGTPWALLTNRSFVCIEISGASVTWSAATEEANHPNVPWSAQRDGLWRVLAKQTSGAYPGDSNSVARDGDGILVHTDTDGDQRMLYHRGSARHWTRDGEGSHGGAPLRLVPLSAIQKLPQVVPDHPTGTGTSVRYWLSQAPDGTLAWAR